MSTQKKNLIRFILKEMKNIFKVVGHMSILLMAMSMLEIGEINPDITFEGLEFLFLAMLAYSISWIFTYLSYRYELRFKR